MKMFFYFALPKTEFLRSGFKICTYSLPNNNWVSKSFSRDEVFPISSITFKTVVISSYQISLPALLVPIEEINTSFVVSLISNNRKCIGLSVVKSHKRRMKRFGSFTFCQAWYFIPSSLMDFLSV